MHYLKKGKSQALEVCPQTSAFEPFGFS